MMIAKTHDFYLIVVYYEERHKHVSVSYAKTNRSYY